MYHTAMYFGWGKRSDSTDMELITNSDTTMLTDRSEIEGYCIC